MQKITPFLWFNTNSEEAINFYTSVFKDAKGEGPESYGGYDGHEEARHFYFKRSLSTRINTPILRTHGKANI